MKTIKNIALTGFLLMGTLNWSYAGVSKNTISGNDNIKKQILKEISFPEFLKGKKDKAEVKVSFRVDKNGKAEIVCINTKDEELRKYVMKKMQSMTFEAQTNESELHNMNLVFKLI